MAVDQLVSSTPWLIAQMTGFITSERYNYATVYVDMASRWTFVHLQREATAEATLESKRAFEAQAARRGISIKAYHADNGIFKAKQWVDACAAAGQPLTFFRVDAHHQNGVTERKIRDL